MKYVIYFFKVMLAGITAMFILSVILACYSFTPVHIENDTGNTDYVWPANSIWIQMTEGISWGQFDADGFNNKEVIANPDIIILGSSHMEAKNVMQDENVGYLLNEMFEGAYSVYNMGISGHHFYKACQYIPASLERFDVVPQVVIVETSTVALDEVKVKQVLQKNVEYTPSYNSGFIALLQKSPFLRLLYQQVDGGLLNLFLESGPIKEDTITSVEDDIQKECDIEVLPYEGLFSYFRAIEDKYNTEIIICYHPEEKLGEDGTIYFENEDYKKCFAETADKFDITFLDLTDAFMDMYYDEHHVPHGFCNGEIASGHLNKYGHAVMAEELYGILLEYVEAGMLCR